MVSIWPWKGNDDSPASFEKSLSTLSTKITKTATRLETFRQRSRRYNILWVFYSTIIYLLYSIILLLVVGWRNWGLLEVGAITVGPILIYAVRLGLVSYYDFRISKTQAQVDESKKQRDTVIEKLKAATKYNTTQELLQKYGGAPSPKKNAQGALEGRPNSMKDNAGVLQGRRTGIVPPPTANISKSVEPAPVSSTAGRSPSGTNGYYSSSSSPKSRPPTSSPQTETAEFAPNAFPTVPQYAPASKGSRWLDRLMDVVLGEDESLPSNRIALICKQCRLVNGQAPPGANRLEDVGRWRCGECGTMNGEESEMKKILAEFKEESSQQKQHRTKNTSSSSSPSKTQIEETNQSLTSSRQNEDRNVNDVSGYNDNEEDEGEESDITQYSDASDREKPKEPSSPSLSNAAHLKSPESAVTTTASEPAEPARRRGVGRPKGSKNKNNS